MKVKKITLFYLFLVLLSGCHREESLVQEQPVRFSMRAVSATHAGGRMAAITTPASVIVTILDNDGKTVAEQTSLKMFKFGENYLSAPLTLKTAKKSSYQLSEYYVTDSTGNVVYATPREGSKLAYLVNDPLNIVFDVSKDQITTVTPEVLSVTNSSAGDFGYGQFGLTVVKTISVTFSGFIKGISSFETTDAHLKIEALNDTTAQNSTIRWKYDVNLSAGANTIQLRQYPYYRITATKPGYAAWQRNLVLNDGDKKEILFLQKVSGLKSIKGVFLYWDWITSYPTQYDITYDKQGRPVKESVIAYRGDQGTPTLLSQVSTFGKYAWPDSVIFTGDYLRKIQLMTNTNDNKISTVSIQQQGNSSMPGMHVRVNSFSYDASGKMTKGKTDFSDLSNNLGYEQYTSYASSGDLTHASLNYSVAEYTGSTNFQEQQIEYDTHANVFSPLLLNYLLTNTIDGFGLTPVDTPVNFVILLQPQKNLIKSFTRTYTDPSSYSLYLPYKSQVDFSYSFDEQGRPVTLTVYLTRTKSSYVEKFVVIKDAKLTYY